MITIPSLGSLALSSPPSHNSEPPFKSGSYRNGSVRIFSVFKWCEFYLIIKTVTFRIVLSYWVKLAFTSTKTCKVVTPELLVGTNICRRWRDPDLFLSLFICFSHSCVHTLDLANWVSDFWVSARLLDSKIPQTLNLISLLGKYEVIPINMTS